MILYFFFVISFTCIGMIRGFMDTDLALSFLKAKHLRHNTILTCDHKRAQVQLSRNLTTPKDMVVSVKYIKFLNISDSIVTHYKKVGIVLDGDCKDARGLLLRCKRYKVFDSKHFWLVLRNTSNYHALFKYANLNVDSDIKVAYPDISGGNYIIEDVYNPAHERGGELKISLVGSYDSVHGYQINERQNKYFVRRNFTGVQFKTVVVLPEPFEGSMADYLLNDRNIEVNTFNRFHSRLMHYCQDYYNFSMEIALDKSWGYLQNDGTMDGLVGDLERLKTDFGLSPLFVKKDRAKFISYGRKTWNLRAAFVLRNPKSRKSYQIFIKPLSLQVWLCIVVSSVLSVFTQKLGYGLDKQLDRKYLKRGNVDNSWSFSTVCTFGAFCQQGIIDFPRSLSGRTAAFVTLLLGSLIYQFYSASLVSFLLNVPTTMISTLQNILDNDFKVGCEDVLYSKDYLKYATDNVTKEIYRRLLMVSNNQSGFLKPEEGLNLVKRGQYAFHVELVTGYPIIEQQFDETTVCELKEVPMFPVKQMHANYQKWSPFKDVIDVCLHRLSENGVITREILFWHPRKPDCMRSSSTININTGLEDFYPALAVLLFGIVLSLEILVIEILWYHRGKRLKLGVMQPFFPYTN